MTFKFGRFGVVLMLKHRWQKNLSYWEKERWNDFRLGPRVRYFGGPKTSVLFGFYLIFAKLWLIVYGD